MSQSNETQRRAHSRIWTDVDLDREGRTFGYLRLNVSSHERPSSFVPVPIGVFKNGPGPRILLLGGVHGDEFEGQVLLMKLLRTLDIRNVRGQLIILPAANAPAAYAGRRTSPLDDKKVIGTCDRLGILRFASELGGGGGITVDALRRAEHGLARLLYDLGALAEPLTAEQ